MAIYSGKAAYKVAHLAYRAIPSVDESSPQALFDLVAAIA